MTLLRSLAFAGGLALLTQIAEAAPAGYGSLGQEYEQVRKIALRDPRVRDAFNRAYERLDAKIVDLDPALAGFVRRNPSGPTPYRPVDDRPIARRESPRPAPASSRPRPSVAPNPSRSRTHVVAPGETLGLIAGRYRVSVATLERANRIQDARKLRAGQTLVVPR